MTQSFETINQLAKTANYSYVSQEYATKQQADQDMPKFRTHPSRVHLKYINVRVERRRAN